MWSQVQTCTLATKTGSQYTMVGTRELNAEVLTVVTECENFAQYTALGGSFMWNSLQTAETGGVALVFNTERL